MVDQSSFLKKKKAQVQITLIQPILVSSAVFLNRKLTKIELSCQECQDVSVRTKQTTGIFILIYWSIFPGSNKIFIALVQVQLSKWSPSTD